MVKHLFCITMLTMGAAAYGAGNSVDSDAAAASMAADMSFQILDVNKDGAIDNAEAKADEALAHDFATIAVDGKVNLQGYLDWKSAHAKPRAS